MNTTIINLSAGPGSGKSTSAAYLFYLLKSAGKNVELVSEYVKDAYAWENRTINTYDQIYFLGKQTKRESLLYGKVDYVITDSPVWMGAYYAMKYCPPLLSEGIRAATVAFYNQAERDGHRHVFVHLQRSKPYNPAGRYQTEDEAKAMDGELKTFLQGLKLDFFQSGTTEEELKSLLLNIAE